MSTLVVGCALLLVGADNDTLAFQTEYDAVNRIVEIFLFDFLCTTSCRP